MRRSFVLAAVVAALVWANPARAVIGTPDDVPAATLLFPYFEVDVDPADTAGVTTLIAIHNTSASAALAHVTLWTDLGIPTFFFDVYLTGYDVQTINLRDIFVSGYLAATASDGQDSGDTISPQGPISQDINYASCGTMGVLPYVNPAVDAPTRAHLVAWHTGSASPTTDTCAGYNGYGDDIARGYVTVDSVQSCSLQTPATPGYFMGIADYRNILVGDYFVVHPGNNFMEAERAVAIEFSATDPLTDGEPAIDPITGGEIPDYTFYGRLVTWTGADHREALPSRWAARYLENGSSYRVWRDPAVPPPAGGFSCATPYPAGFPLDTVQVVAFDTQENPELLTGSYFPLAVQEVDVDASGIAATAKQGWMHLILDAATPLPAFPGAHRQSWVEIKQQTQGRFSAGWPAASIDPVDFGPGTLDVPDPD